jgi:hypothetical protein
LAVRSARALGAQRIEARSRADSHLIGGCLAATGLKIEPGDHIHYEFNLVRRQKRTASLLVVDSA